MNALAFVASREATSFSVEIVHDIEAARNDWLLLEAAGAGSIFQHFNLMTLWYQALKPETGRAVIVLVRCANTGCAVAIFPMVSRRRGFVTWLELADGGVLDYCQPLLHPDKISSANIAVLMQAVEKALPGDVLYINKVPAQLHNRPNPMVTLEQRARLMLSSWYVPLAENAWQDVVLPRQSTQHKSQVRRKRRKLEREHGLLPSLAVGDELMEQDYALLREMRTNHFASEARVDTLTSPRWQAFYHALFCGKGGPVQPWMSRIDCGSETIAVLFGLIDDRGAIALLPASQRGNWTKYAPGTLLFDASMELFTARGAAGLDLSIGDNPYKNYIGAEKVALYDFMFAGSPLGKLLCRLWRTKVTLRNSFLVHKILRGQKPALADSGNVTGN